MGGVDLGNYSICLENRSVLSGVSEPRPLMGAKPLWAFLKLTEFHGYGAYQSVETSTVHSRNEQGFNGFYSCLQRES